MGFQNKFGHREKIIFAALTGPPTPVDGPDTLAFVAVVTSRGGVVTTAEKGYLTTFENDLSTNITEFDRLWIHGLSNNIAARTSFVNPSTTIITAVNAPTFTANQGYTGGPAMYLDSNFSPAIDGVKYQQDNAGIFIYSITNLAFDSAEIGNQLGGNYSYILSRSALGSAVYALNSSNDTAVAVADSLSLFQVLRTGTNPYSLYVRNSLIATVNQASRPLINQNYYLLSRNTNGVPTLGSFKTISASGFSSSSINQANFYAALQTLGTSIGWAV
jgi:hypothetical protein